MQIYRYTNVQLCNYKQMQTIQNIKVYKYHNIQIQTYTTINIYKYQTIQRKTTTQMTI